MAKLTKKQESQFKVLLDLLHEMIKSKMDNKRSDYEEVIKKIKEEVEDE